MEEIKFCFLCGAILDEDEEIFCKDCEEESEDELFYMQSAFSEYC